MNTNGCKYCRGGKLLESEVIGITVSPANLELFYDAYSVDSSFEESIPIVYCPMCGEKLKEGEESE